MGGDARWPVWKIAVALYPFAAGAVAINLFFLSLMGQAIGLSAISPSSALGGGLILGAPAVLWFAGRMRRLMDQADEE